MRIKFIISLFILVWISLLTRIFYLSIQSNNYYEHLSSQNSTKVKFIPPVRGEILDRKLRPIAINKLGFKIQLKPHLRSKKNLPKLYEEVDNIVSLIPTLHREKLIKTYLKKDSYYNHEFIDVVDFITYEEIMPVYTKLNLRENLNIMSAPKRYYPNAELATHVIGYVAKANKADIEKDDTVKLIGKVGRTGIEKYYNDFLQGEAGQRVLKVSAKNELIKELSYKAPLEDRQLVLGIDIELQKYISKLFKGKVGAVVVMNVDGTIISAGSFPEYNPNLFVSGISTKDWKKLISNVDKPFTNKLINGLYPPGSTIKTGLGLIYITTDINEWWKVKCTASFELGDRNFRCWKEKGHHGTDINKAIRESCDDYFYKASVKVGIAKMSEGLRRFGLGKKTGIDLPREFVGTVPSRMWKREKYNRPWYIGETLNSSIGQGDSLSSPMQITRFTALMATGKLPTPHIATEIGGQKVEAVYEDILTPEEKKKLPLIQKAMKEVCNHPRGTATRYLSSKVKMAGKTGTAQVVGIAQDVKKRLKEDQMEYYKRSHAWFTSYAPYNNPQYVVTVLVEHGGHGGSAAGAITSKIYNKLLKLGYIKK
ncbi:MAG: penicillin-binding protein 2 [Helicobacteraceae bacterium]|nr:penicillin-binding protein 2 [Helicobacteraceae bacterium]